MAARTVNWASLSEVGLHVPLDVAIRGIGAPVAVHVQPHDTFERRHCNEPYCSFDATGRQGVPVTVSATVEEWPRRLSANRYAIGKRC